VGGGNQMSVKQFVPLNVDKEEKFKKLSKIEKPLLIKVINK